MGLHGVQKAFSVREKLQGILIFVYFHGFIQRNKSYIIYAQNFNDIHHLGGCRQGEERQLCFLDGEHHAWLCECKYQNKSKKNMKVNGKHHAYLKDFSKLIKFKEWILIVIDDINYNIDYNGEHPARFCELEYMFTMNQRNVRKNGMHQA